MTEQNGDFYINIWRENLRFNGQVRLACPCFCSYSSSAWAGLRTDILLASKNDVTAQNLFWSKSNHPTKLQRSTNQLIITKHSPRQQWKPAGLRESPNSCRAPSGARDPATRPPGLRRSRLSTQTEHSFSPLNTHRLLGPSRLSTRTEPSPPALWHPAPLAPPHLTTTTRVGSCPRPASLSTPATASYSLPGPATCMARSTWPHHRGEPSSRPT